MPAGEWAVKRTLKPLKLNKKIMINNLNVQPEQRTTDNSKTASILPSPKRENANLEYNFSTVSKQSIDVPSDHNESSSKKISFYKKDPSLKDMPNFIEKSDAKEVTPFNSDLTPAKSNVFVGKFSSHSIVLDHHKYDTPLTNAVILLSKCVAAFHS